MTQKKKKILLADQTLVVYTDGGARGNPGPAAIGIVIQNQKREMLATYAKALGDATNNEAEYQAVIFALEKIKLLWGRERARETDVQIRLDSEIVGRQMRGEYRIEESRLQALFIKLWNLGTEFKSLSFFTIPREENRAADRLLNEVLDKEQKNLF